MKKEKIRREFLKLKLKGLSYKECRIELLTLFRVKRSLPTLKRWWKIFNEDDNWDLRDTSQRPHKINYKFSKSDVGEILELRSLTGYSSYQISEIMKRKGLIMSESSIKSAVKRAGLSRGNKMEGKRIKWVLFERPESDYMWQVDGTQLDDGRWLIPVIDDHSRYWIGYTISDVNTTEVITKLLESCIAMHGKPLQILTDNGSEFGGNGKGDNEFDRWCAKQGIEHIRSRIHKPTTVGKISRLQYTISYELPYCYNDYEYCRCRYNHDRPHRSLNGLTPAEVYFKQKRHKKYK